jgi:DNA primase catalytic core
MSQPVRIPDGFVEELKARIRPSDVIGRKVKLTKKGKEWVGLSPFTNEKTPSFYVNDQKRIFKCFSSGTGGDVINFIMETERLTFIEAVEKLAEEAGMQLPKASPEAAEAYDHRKRLVAACEAAANWFEDRLRSGEGAAARTYLDGRGLSGDAWKRHRLGYAPDDWRRTRAHLLAQGFTDAELIAAGLIKESDKGGEPFDFFRGRLMFPITDVRGAVIAFGGRGLTPDAKPKYLNSGDTELFHKSAVLYRYKAAREALGAGEGGGLIVCEGYMDAIALAEAGFGQAVAPLGTALTEDQLQLIWKAGPEPVMCFDGDRAGLGAAYRALDRALPFVEIRITDPVTLNEAGTGAVGEIWVRSEMVMPGYWQNPAATADAIMAGGWLRTGDAAYRDADGFIYLYDRFKDMIISGGENIYPAEIENVLLSHPAVSEIAVIGIPHARWVETPRAIVVLRTGMTTTERELIDFARSRLAHYKCPTSVLFADMLPRNASGKLLKRELRKTYRPSG